MTPSFLGGGGGGGGGGWPVTGTIPERLTDGPFTADNVGATRLITPPFAGVWGAVEVRIEGEETFGLGGIALALAAPGRDR